MVSASTPASGTRQPRFAATPATASATNPAAQNAPGAARKAGAAAPPPPPTVPPGEPWTTLHSVPPQEILSTRAHPLVG